MAARSRAIRVAYLWASGFDSRRKSPLFTGETMTKLFNMPLTPNMGEAKYREQLMAKFDDDVRSTREAIVRGRLKSFCDVALSLEPAEMEALLKKLDRLRAK